MLLYLLDTYNYDRGAFYNRRRSMVAVTAETCARGRNAEDKIQTAVSCLVLLIHSRQTVIIFLMEGYLLIVNCKPGVYPPIL